MARKLLHISAIVDASITYELMELLEGRTVAGTLVMKPVRHGGEDESGQLKSAPSGREFALAFIAKHPAFRVRDAIHAAAALGITKQTVYTTISTLKNEGVLKSTEPGHYAVKGGKAVAKAATVARGRPKAGGEPVTARILSALAKLQNGSGEGVHIREIKKAIGETRNISPAFTTLLRQKKITRPKPQHYRAREEA